MSDVVRAENVSVLRDTCIEQLFLGDSPYSRGFRLAIPPRDTCLQAANDLHFDGAGQSFFLGREWVHEHWPLAISTAVMSRWKR